MCKFQVKDSEISTEQIITPMVKHLSLSQLNTSVNQSPYNEKLLLKIAVELVCIQTNIQTDLMFPLQVQHGIYQLTSLV